MNIVFVCSNPTHVRTFEPVVGELSRMGHHSSLLTLDLYYGGGSLAEAASRGVDAQLLERSKGQLAAPFYDRPVLSIWADVVSARLPLARQLTILRPDRVVVGNDFGLMEKLVLWAAGSAGVTRVLVQDGRLSRDRPRPPGLRGAVGRHARRGLSAVLRGLGLGYLAMSEYGEGPAEVVCASDRASAELLLDRGRGRARVVVTGQPRFDAYRVSRPAADPARMAARNVVFFTTPFEADRLGTRPQASQLALALSLAAVAREVGGTLIIKPHPRDEQDYDVSLNREVVVDRRPAMDVLAGAWVAILGISTVVEEAGLAGVPVIVPGQVIHEHRFDGQLPDSQVYPRFESAEQAAGLLSRLRDSGAWEELATTQQRHGVPDLRSTSENSAAASVAAAILEA